MARAWRRTSSATQTMTSAKRDAGRDACQAGREPSQEPGLRAVAMNQGKPLTTHPADEVGERAEVRQWRGNPPQRLDLDDRKTLAAEPSDERPSGCASHRHIVPAAQTPGQGKDTGLRSTPIRQRHELE